MRVLRCLKGKADAIGQGTGDTVVACLSAAQ